MAAEPIVIYAHKIDPEGVLACLRTLAPDLKVTVGGNGWSRITITSRTGLFRKPSTITFAQDPGYYASPNFQNQMRGMMGYFSRFPANELTPRILYLIASFRFAITLHPSPDPELHLDTNDARLKYLFAVVKHLDGAIFTPSGLRDAAGRVLYHASLKLDSQAVMPGIYKEAPKPSELPLYMGGTALNPPLPPADRVARRALCLAAVAWRGMLERTEVSPDLLEKTRINDLSWVDAIGIASELEPDEQRLLECPIGSGDAKEFTNAEWRSEGAALLAWALGRFDLPPYDVQTDVGNLGRSLGMESVEDACAFLADPVLRTASEIKNLAKELLGIHWRLRELQLRPVAMDFETYSQKGWFGSLPEGNIRFLNRDLAIGKSAVSDAPQQVLLPVALTIAERHRAINWLCGDDPIYSKTDMQT